MGAGLRTNRMGVRTAALVNGALWVAFPLVLKLSGTWDVPWPWILGFSAAYFVMFGGSWLLLMPRALVWFGLSPMGSPVSPELRSQGLRFMWEIVRIILVVCAAIAAAFVLSGMAGLIWLPLLVAALSIGVTLLLQYVLHREDSSTGAPPEGTA
jgi:hypothetical protein